MMALYPLLLFLGLLACLPAAIARRRLPHRLWSMRLGRYPEALRRSLQGGKSIWVHAVSVGEVLAAQPLIELLLRARPAQKLLLTTVTPGGFGVIQRRFGGRVIAAYFPLDFGFCVRRAFDAFNPAALLLVESELWPTVIRTARARRVPVIVVNGRVSPRAFARHRRIRRWLKPVLDGVAQWLMQSREDAERIIALGAAPARVQVLGSLKWDASIGARPSDESVRALAQRLGLESGIPVIVAGSTHRGEEGAVLQAFRAIRPQHPAARLIIAPRHLERLGEVERIIRQQGWTAARLSEPPAGAWDVGIVDTFGQLPLYYALASFVFIGGSLIAHGGQNPLEAASLGKPVVFGPSMYNFAVIAHQLLAHHAAYKADDASRLSAIFRQWLADPASASAMGGQARALTERFQGAAQRTLEAVIPWLSGDRAWPKGYG